MSSISGFPRSAYLEEHPAVNKELEQAWSEFMDWLVLNLDSTEADEVIRLVNNIVRVCAQASK